MKAKIIWLILIGLAVIIQFFPSGRPETTADKQADLIANNNLPDSVKQILKTSCYDCHSNETVYPWYAYVAPVSWLVSRDVRIGRKKLNFSEWENLDKIKKATQLDNISDEVDDEEMPMPIYLVMHSDAKLTQEQRNALIAWTEDYADSLFE